MSVRMRHTRAHTANRRSHHHLDEPRLSICGNCGAPHLRHRVCGECGWYRGRMIVDAKAEAEKRADRRKAKLRSMGVGDTGGSEESKEEQKPLNAEDLSKK